MYKHDTGELPDPEHSTDNKGIGRLPGPADVVDYYYQFMLHYRDRMVNIKFRTQRTIELAQMDRRRFQCYFISFHHRINSIRTVYGCDQSLIKSAIDIARSNRLTGYYRIDRQDQWLH